MPYNTEFNLRSLHSWLIENLIDSNKQPTMITYGVMFVRSYVCEWESEDS